jgi:hypothetical protein
MTATIIRRACRRVSTYIKNRKYQARTRQRAERSPETKGGRPPARAPTDRGKPVYLLLRHQLHAPVLRAAFGGIVRRDEISLAEALSDQHGARDALPL